MPCLASFFHATSGVKKLADMVPAITCPTSANEDSKAPIMKAQMPKLCNAGYKFESFLTPCLASKSCQILYTQLIAQLRHLSLLMPHFCKQRQASTKPMQILNRELSRQVKPRVSKLGNWLRIQSIKAFWCQKCRQKTLPNVALVRHW